MKIKLLHTIFFMTVLLSVSNQCFAWTWQDLWYTPDQQGQIELEKGNARQAAQLFTSKEWQAAALYRAKDYAASAKIASTIHTPTSYYNQANALALAGKLKEALTLYDKALAAEPTFKDAAYNREIIKKLLDQDNKQSSSQNQQNKDNTGQNSSKNNASAQNQSNDSSQAQPTQNTANSSNSKPQENSKNDASSFNSSTQSAKDNSTADTVPNNNPSNSSPLSKKQAEQNKVPASSAAKPSHQTEHSSLKQPENSKQKSNNANSKNSTVNEEEQATEQWLKSITDDPGGLLKQKFLRDHQRYQAAKEQINDQ